MTIGKVINRFRDLEALHNYEMLNSSQVGIIYNNLASLAFIDLDKTISTDRGLQRKVYLSSDRDDLLFALRDDEVAVKVFGRQFFSK